MWPVKFRGDDPRLSVAEYNAQRKAAQRALQNDLRQVARGQVPHRPSSTMCLVRAHTSMSRWQPIQLTTPLFVPTGADMPKGLEMQMAFQGAEPQARKRWGILVEPIGANKLGWCVTHGLAIANVNIVSVDRPNIGCDADGGSTLTIREGGPARILYRQAGTGVRPCVIELVPTTPRNFIATTNAAIAAGAFGLVTAVGDTSFIVSAKNEAPTGTIASGKKIACQWDDLQRHFYISMEFCEE